MYSTIQLSRRGLFIALAAVAFTASVHQASAQSTSHSKTDTAVATDVDGEIKALPAEEIQGYLLGKGMGLAKAAELNGYPGPAHVLALAGELGLSADQKHRTELLFKLMETKAQEIGHPLVDEERKLDQLFASKAISSESLTASLNRIGDLQARLRQVHMESHLEQWQILTPEQISTYMTLRGHNRAEKTMEPPRHKHTSG